MTDEIIIITNNLLVIYIFLLKTQKKPQEKTYGFKTGIEKIIDY